MTYKQTRTVGVMLLALAVSFRAFAAAFAPPGVPLDEATWGGMKLLHLTLSAAAAGASPRVAAAIRLSASASARRSGLSRTITTGTSTRAKTTTAPAPALRASTAKRRCSVMVLSPWVLLKGA